MPADCDSVCTTADSRGLQTSCFADSVPCASCTAASGTGTPTAGTRPHRPRARNSGEPSSMRTSNETEGTTTICSRPAGELAPSGNVPCASRSRWRSSRRNSKAGCAEARPRSRRVGPCRMPASKSAQRDDDGPEHPTSPMPHLRYGTETRESPRRTGRSRTASERPSAARHIICDTGGKAGSGVRVSLSDPADHPRGPGSQSSVRSGAH